MRHTLLLLFLVACTDDVLSVDEWNGETEADTNAPPTHPLEDCPGNAPGGPVSDPPGGRPIPKERKCGNEPTRSECLECCDWNFKNVWGEKCLRMKDPRKRAKCYEEAESYKRPNCQAGCEQPILTIGPLP